MFQNGIQINILVYESTRKEENQENVMQVTEQTYIHRFIYLFQRNSLCFRKKKTRIYSGVLEHSIENSSVFRCLCYTTFLSHYFFKILCNFLEFALFNTFTTTLHYQYKLFCFFTIFLHNFFILFKFETSGFSVFFKIFINRKYKKDANAIVTFSSPPKKSII